MRVFLLVVDGFGVGELPDAKEYHDEGSNTLKNLYDKMLLDLPNLEKLGLYNIDGLGILAKEVPIGAFGKMAEISKAKDSTAGHWEMVGSPILEPFPTFKDGIIPNDLVEKLESAFKVKTLCNKAMSGTEVIQKFGSAHMDTRMPIVYTSADSVLQIACHELIYSTKQLYRLCEIARGVCVGKYEVARVIARPFAGDVGAFYRTPYRKDFSVEPKKPIILEKIKNAGQEVIGVGKIEDLLPKRFLTQSYHTKTNDLALKTIIKMMDKDFNGLVFANLLDTDQVYGHRNDALGYRKCLEELDAYVEKILAKLKSDDILILTSDHGNDPTTVSTDHSREYVPLLIYGEKIKQNHNLKTLPTFACVGATIIDALLDIKTNLSFWGNIQK